MKRWPLLLVLIVSLGGIAFAGPPEWADGIRERLPWSFGGLDGWQWAFALGLFVLSMLTHGAAKLIAKRLIALRRRYSGATVGTLGERSIKRGAGFLGFVLPWYLFSAMLELGTADGQHVESVIQGVTIVGLVLLVYGIWDAVCDTLIHRTSTSHTRAERLLIPVTRKLVRFIILLGGGLLALGVFGVNITGLLAGVGIGGLVVALAAKDSVENIFGSLTILFDMPFALGDWVKIDKVEGIVEEINLRSTRIRTFEDSMITLPNSNLIKAAVENYGARRYRRQRFHVRLSYHNKAENLDAFLKLIREYLESVEQVVKARTVVEVNDFTEASVGVLIQCFFEVENFQDEAKLRSDLILAIFRAGEESDVYFVGVSPESMQADDEAKAQEKQEEEDEEKKKKEREEEDGNIV